MSKINIVVLCISLAFDEYDCRQTPFGILESESQYPAKSNSQALFAGSSVGEIHFCIIITHFSITDIPPACSEVFPPFL